jgi:hypothetical protein
MAVQRFHAISDWRAAARLSKAASPDLRMFESVLSLMSFFHFEIEPYSYGSSASVANLPGGLLIDLIKVRVMVQFLGLYEAVIDPLLLWNAACLPDEPVSCCSQRNEFPRAFVCPEMHRRIEPSRERPPFETCRCPSWLRSLSCAESGFAPDLRTETCDLASAPGNSDQLAPIFPVSLSESYPLALDQRKHLLRLPLAGVLRAVVRVPTRGRYHDAESPSGSWLSPLRKKWREAFRAFRL